jgi:hypothetical protein
MSKNSLYLIVAIALAATAATFFVTGHDPKRVCFMTDTGPAGQNFINPTAAGTDDSVGTKATTRGYPFRYYEDPFPVDCISQSSSGLSNTFNTAHLAYDLLVWLAAAFLLFLPSALLGWWRGPRMLGDFKGRA